MIVYVDITNLLTTRYITGIQRVVREVMTRIIDRDKIDVRLIQYRDGDKSFYKVSESFFDEFLKMGKSRSRFSARDRLSVDDLENGSIFFDIDGVWHSTRRRSVLYPELKKKDIKIMNMIYDVIPITGPMYCHENTVINFMAYFGAVLEYSSLIIVNAQATKDHICDIASRIGVTAPKCEVVPLGADFKTNQGKTVDISEVSDDVKNAVNSGKYILMVGTIEPRKNHKYLLDALDNGLSTNVIFAGRQGWNVADLVERIENSPRNGKNLFWLNNCSDSDIQYLYSNAYFVVFPTIDEGYGLPVIEAIMKGTPVIASDIPVVREVGGGYISYVDNSDPADLIRVLDECQRDEDVYKKKQDMLKGYKPFSWDDCSVRVENEIENIIN